MFKIITWMHHNHACCPLVMVTSCVGVTGRGICSGLNIDNVHNHIIYRHICVHTQEVIVQLWEMFKFLFHLYKNLDILHKCIKSCNRLNGICDEKILKSLHVKFQELMPRLGNNLLIRKHTRSTLCVWWKMLQGAQQNYANKRKFSNHFFRYVP